MADKKAVSPVKMALKEVIDWVSLTFEAILVMVIIVAIIVAIIVGVAVLYVWLSGCVRSPQPLRTPHYSKRYHCSTTYCP